MKSRKRMSVCSCRRKQRRFIRAAVEKAVAKEVSLGWPDYYPVCPVCGSREVKKIGGKVWKYCPECGQRLKDVEINLKGGGAGYETPDNK